MSGGGKRSSRANSGYAGGDLGRWERFKRRLRWYSGVAGRYLLERGSSAWRRAGIEAVVAVLVLAAFLAFAVPVYMQERSASVRTAAESDLRNGAAAAQRYAADHEGAYDGVPPFNARTLQRDYGWRLSSSAQDASAREVNGGAGFVIEVDVSSSETLSYSSSTGEVEGERR